MTKRERVEAAMKLQETDRVPVYDLLVNDAVIEYFAGRYPPIGEEGIGLKCKAISRSLDMTRSAAYGPQEIGEWTTKEGDGGFADGFVYYRSDRYIEGGIKKRPFHNEKGAVVWLKRKNQELKKELKNLDLKKFKEDHHLRFNQIQGYIGDDTVQLLRESGTGLDWIRAAIGLELFSFISVDMPGLISEHMELYVEREIRIIHAIADKRLSPCVLTYGDIACKDRLLHSPDWLRKEFFPRLKRINKAWHEYDIKCLFHSDGYLMDIIPDLIEAGIDGLNPIETLAGMDLKEVKRLCGDKIFIAGGIDISQLLSNGRPEEVRRVCQEAIDIASPGYFIGSTTELDNGSKLENILAMLETAWNTLA